MQLRILTGEEVHSAIDMNRAIRVMEAAESQELGRVVEL